MSYVLSTSVCSVELHIIEGQGLCNEPQLRAKGPLMTCEQFESVEFHVADRVSQHLNIAFVAVCQYSL